MMKKFLGLLICICFAAAAVLICSVVWNRNSRRDQAEHLESLRDQLKVYQTTEEAGSPIQEITDPPKIEDPVIPETEQPETETEEEIQGINAFLDRYNKPEKIELLPYHKLGEHKYSAIGREACVFPVPSEERLDAFLQFIEQIDKSKLTIQQSLDKLELLKKSLMQEYFG